MNTSDFHLNLMKPTERLSSSPVRLRVMLPILSLLAVAGMALWAMIVFGQYLLVKTQAATIDDDIKAKKNQHVEVLDRMNYARELDLEVEQLEYYRSGIRHLAEPLAELAEVMPLRVQLTELALQPPARQILQPPGAKVALLGPTTNVETQKLVVVGRTTKETPVVALMESLDSPEFAKLVTREKKINSFKQDDASAKGGKQLLSFEIEYVMPERKFAQ